MIELTAERKFILMIQDAKYKKESPREVINGTASNNLPYSTLQEHLTARSYVSTVLLECRDISWTTFQDNFSTIKFPQLLRWGQSTGRTFLVIQWFRIHLARQRTQVQSLVEVQILHAKEKLSL